jgi:hypothetical protein
MGGAAAWPGLGWPGVRGGRRLVPGPFDQVAGHVVQLDVAALGDLDQQLERLIG